MAHGHGVAAAELVAAGAALLALALYLAGAARLWRAGRRWHPRRAAAALGGCAALAAAALAPALGSSADVRWHMGQHLLVGMLAPPLLALSAPVTLALRAAPGLRPALAALLHLRLARALVVPEVAAALMVGGLYALYLTPLYGIAARRADAHALMHLHVLAAGCLFAWAVLAADPIPGRASVGRRVAVLVAASAAHAVLAKLMAHAGPGAAGVPEVARADWQAGAVLMYSGGGAVEVLMLTVVLWRRERSARRRQRARPRATAAPAAGRRGCGGAPTRAYWHSQTLSAKTSGGRE